MIKIGCLYFFGELWDGNGGDGAGRELLESGCVSPDNVNVVAFTIEDRDENILQVLVRVTEIY